MAQYQSFPDAAGDSRTLDKLKALRLPDLKGRSFLDVGCNEGFFCGFALYQGASRAVGIDYSLQFIERARRRFPQGEFFHQSWDALPGDRFDVILLASALHYADDQAELIRRLVDCLSPDGVLVLELGIVSSPKSEWVNVKRGIDEREFPTMPKLREVLEDYAWKWMGPSVQQSGDPVPRHVLHINRRRPMAYLLLEPPGYGKSSIASRLFPPAGVRVVSGDARLDEAARGRGAVPPAIQPYLKEYSPFTLDRLIERVFEAGLGRDLIDFWIGELDGADFALEVYVPAACQQQVVCVLREVGYFPVRLNWERVGASAVPADLIAEHGEKFYLSLGEPVGDEVAVSGAHSFKPVGFVDDLVVQGESLFVRGWAIDARGHLPRRFMVRVGDTMLEAESVAKELRPDVQRHLSLPHALVGFRFTIPVKVSSIAELGRSFECVSPDAGGGPFRLVSVLASRMGAGDPLASRN